MFRRINMKVTQTYFAVRVNNFGLYCSLKCQSKIFNHIGTVTAGVLFKDTTHASKVGTRKHLNPVQHIPIDHHAPQWMDFEQTCIDTVVGRGERVD